MTLGQPTVRKVHTAANGRFMPEPTARYNAGIQYSRLIHRRCASLDLEAAFKEIKISQNVEKEVCNQCQAETCRSHVRRRHHYFIYNMLDDIGERTQQKQPRNNSPSVQGPPVEH